MLTTLSDNEKKIWDPGDDINIHILQCFQADIRGYSLEPSKGNFNYFYTYRYFKKGDYVLRCLVHNDHLERFFHTEIYEISGDETFLLYQYYDESSNKWLSKKME